MDLSGSHSAEESESCPGGPQRGVSLQSTPLQPPRRFRAPAPHVLLTFLSHQVQARWRHGGSLGAGAGSSVWWGRGAPSPCQWQVDSGGVVTAVCSALLLPSLLPCGPAAEARHRHLVRPLEAVPSISGPACPQLLRNPASVLSVLPSSCRGQAALRLVRKSRALVCLELALQRPQMGSHSRDSLSPRLRCPHGQGRSP